MDANIIDTKEKMLIDELKVDCTKCFGLCCIALYFSATDGFPKDKEAGVPCIHLEDGFTCAVHKNLREKGLKGCTGYDCFGAGQKVAEVTFCGRSWREDPKIAKPMFEAFLIMRQLHEMLWYLTEIDAIERSKEKREEIQVLIGETKEFTLLPLDALLKLDIENHRLKVNQLLKYTSGQLQAEVMSRKISNKNSMKNSKNTGKSKYRNPFDYIGADLRKEDLRGANLMGACLIATNLSGSDLSYSNLIGADLRDANLSGANLEKSIFLTQAQINTAKGDSKTKLPKRIVRPSHWTK
ncbi:pentapeptide repeat-containing protein [Anaeromicropila herbilytica]|uniref:Pentapeptide repeat-containing protein n=1 Tax=Anaeromicropila herbilytica TaxID=2785025 RepID=A0A7R7EJG1_9FIRM|nr:pentapeptide repeat-containing protein [Anaeromicropila herbilytica]BCN29951.1 hypothetical protein bsdtb5_12460 [Anaeromicropila herbilytica]